MTSPNEMNGKTLYYLGPEDSFSHEGALDLQKTYPGMQLKKSPYISKKLAKDQTQAVEPGVWERMLDEGHLGLVPAENSSPGSGKVKPHLDLIRTGAARILAEVNVSVNASVGAKPGTTLENAVKVYSHVQGLKQTSRFRSQYAWQSVETDSTVAAAEIVRDDQEQSLAIASPIALKNRGLNILAPDIGNLKSDLNFTQMFLMTRNGIKHVFQPEMEYHALIVRLPERVGTLLRLLNAIRVTETNLTSLHSLPDPTDPKAIDFFLELESYDQGTLDILSRQLEPEFGITERSQILGSWNVRQFTGPGNPESHSIPERLISGTLDPHSTLHEITIRLNEHKGVLANILTMLANADINLTDIDSHTEGHKEYSFQISLDSARSTPSKVRLVHEQLSCSRFVQQMDWKSMQEPPQA